MKVLDKIIWSNKESKIKEGILWLKGNNLNAWLNDGWTPIGGWDKGTSNYNDLINKPRINGTTLQGDVKLDLGTNVEVVNNLTSTSISAALSANQGRVLNGKIAENLTKLNTLQDSLESKADSASTLEGYGITNAYTKSEANTAISNAINNIDLSNYALKTDIVTYENATQTSDGLMSKEDKIKLDNFTGSEVVILTSDEYTILQANGGLKENVAYYIKN